MTHEYGEVINAQVIRMAAEATLELRREEPGVALEVQVEQAIHLSFCACVVDDEDVVENGLSGTHAAIIEEVTRRVKCLLNLSPDGDHKGDGARVSSPPDLQRSAISKGNQHAPARSR